jgi:hypothetical protein
MFPRSFLAAIQTVGALATIALAQTQTIQDNVKRGDTNFFDITLTVKGELRVQKDGKNASIPLAANARLQFSERVLELHQSLPNKVARHYELAKSRLAIDGQIIEKSLRDDRKITIAQRHNEQFLCYSPAGPMLREELEVASEHFDTLALTGLLPEQAVKVGDTWKIPNPVAQSLCQFEGLLTNELTGKLDEVKDGFADMTIRGKAQGIELGAMCKLEVTAKVRYELLPKRIVSLEWTQKDERDQGPVSPASSFETTTVLQRRAIAQPKELTDAALESVPKGFEPPLALTLVYQSDAKQRFDVALTREWRMVAQTENHLVFRLLERGDLVAQVALTAWTKAEAGKHLSADEFKQVIAETPGWQLEEILEAAEVPVENGRWLYRIVARGAMEDVKVVQNFYLLAAPSGEQLVATFTMKPNQVAKLGIRDLTLLGAIGFPPKK